jgi:succinate dehydrogenase/fumarate reductase cytochrome b subunit
VSNVATARQNEDFEAKNARLGRPQSPHLSIYKPQLTSLLSVAHRATGMALGGIITVWGIGKIIALLTELPLLGYYYKYRNILTAYFYMHKTIINESVIMSV